MNYIIVGLYYIFYIYFGFMVASILLSWVPKLLEFKIFRWIYNIGNWYLEPFHGVIVLGFLDFTSVIGLLIYQFIMNTFLWL